MSPFKIQGMALVSVLIFLVILAGLNIYMLKANSWELHLAGNSWRKNLIVYAAEKQLAASLSASMPSCQINQTLAQDFIGKPLSWWQAHACAGNSGTYQYYYVLEAQGNDACAQTTESSADYYHLTLLMLEKDMPSQSRTLVQATTIVPHNGTSVCKLGSHKVKAGIQQLQVLA